MSKTLPLAYCASAFRAQSPDVARANIDRARALCRYALSKGFSPYAPHLLLTQFLSDETAEHRELGIAAGSAVLLEHCEAFFVVREDIQTSSGVRAELAAWETRQKVERDLRAPFYVFRSELEFFEVVPSEVWR